MNKFQLIDHILTQMNGVIVTGYPNICALKDSMDGLAALSQMLTKEDEKTAERIKTLEDKIAALEPKDDKVVELKGEKK